jgi:uncharacterized membrane protein YidH (DUF202 family)
MKKLKREEIEEEIMHENPTLIEVALSKERTILSRERTAIALAQLALGVAALGFIVVRFFTGVEYQWFPIIGAALVIVSAYMFYHSLKNYRHLEKKLRHLHDARGHLDRVYWEE